jgi:hypothetical protein
MRMPRTRCRLWMVMALIAVAGLAMGAYKERERARLERERAELAAMMRRYSRLFICPPGAGRPIKITDRRRSDIPYPEVAPIGFDSDRPPLSPSPCPSPESASGRR